METTEQRAAHEAARAQTSRAELAERISQVVRVDGTLEPMDGIRLRRSSAPTELGHGVSFPSVCITAQGSKEVLLGEKHYRYDPAHYLIATAALPIASRITEASPEQPFLSLLVKLDAVLVGAVLVEAEQPVSLRQPTVSAISVSALDAGLLDAMVRLVRLLDAPAEARFLAPLITREIVFRLLMGEQRQRLAHVAAWGGADHRIAEAVEQLRRNFDQPLRIDALAHRYGMSVSGFHHHFRAVTAMSPLQFQKQLRLQEARRLMLGEGMDAASAGFQVGYGDASHFTREYKRLFGAPPMRDVEQRRAGTSDYVAQGTV